MTDSWVTIDERPVFIGGPGAGGGGTAPKSIRNDALEFDSHDIANKWAGDNWEYVDDVTPQELGLISYYAGDAYEELNSNLRFDNDLHAPWLQHTAQRLDMGVSVDDIRTGKVSQETITNAYVSALDTTMAKCRAPADVVVHRGFGDAMFIRGLDIGDEFTDKAFVSTSMLQSVALGFSQRGGSVARIVIPKGTASMHIGTAGAEGEAEILLPRNTTFRLLGSQVVGDVTVFDLVVVEN